MNCLKCDFVLPENSKFCPKCGGQVVLFKKEEKQEKSAIDEIANHLEFLGYTVTKENSNEIDVNEKYFYFASHQKLNNIVFFNILDNSILFKVTLSSNNKICNEMFKYVNLANEKYLNYCKVYISNKEEDKTLLVFEVVYIGGYNKTTFSEFFTELTADLQRFSAGDNFDKLFTS